MDNPTTIATNESEKQLYIGLTDDFFEWRGKIRKYLSKKGLDRLEYYEDIFRLFYVMEAYMKQLAAKMVRNSNEIAKDISNRIAKDPTKNPALMQRFNELDSNLARLENHAYVGMHTSNALMQFARKTREPVATIRARMAARVSEFQKKVAELQRQQVVAQKQKDKKQIPDHEKLRRLPDEYKKRIDAWQKQQSQIQASGRR